MEKSIGLTKSSMFVEKSTGEAFAEYETAEEASQVQEDRNNRNLGERYIEYALHQLPTLFLVFPWTRKCTRKRQIRLV